MQTDRTIRLQRDTPHRAHIRFRMADGRDGQPTEGRLRFRVYNLHDDESILIDINSQPLASDAIIERRKTNIHVAADRRFPGMHIPPHIAYEVDLLKCPPFAGDNEIGFTFSDHNPVIEGGIMIEALEIDVGWEGHPQTVGYLVEPECRT